MNLPLTSPGHSRRVVLGSAVSAGVASAVLPAVGAEAAGSGEPVRPIIRRTSITAENQRPASADWKMGAGGTKPSNDFALQVSGFAGKTSIQAGESLDFYVTSDPTRKYTIAIYRMGYYGGLGGRLVTKSPVLAGKRQAVPTPDQFGAIACRWQVSWTLQTSPLWTPGLYQAVFTNTAGYRSVTPFVVRDDDRAANLCVVLPFTTYQAYNQWPRNGKTGKNLYRGYQPVANLKPMTHAPLTYATRARKVSFHRPYANDGRPMRFEIDTSFVSWVEREGYNVTYATNVDVAEGRVNLERYAGLVFSGHDEYWSQEMRERVQSAVDAGTSLAFMAANNIYWKIRVEGRQVVCFRENDPVADPTGQTVLWRSLEGNKAEQGLLGVQYDGILPAQVPLIVSESNHWLWEGTGVRNGDAIPKVVGGEADGFHNGLPVPAAASQTLLSSTPYKTAAGRAFTQNTSVCEFDSGALIFAAGTFYWTAALIDQGMADKRIQQATVNLLDRMIAARK